MITIAESRNEFVWIAGSAGSWVSRILPVNSRKDMIDPWSNLLLCWVWLWCTDNVNFGVFGSGLGDFMLWASVSEYSHLFLSSPVRGFFLIKCKLIMIKSAMLGMHNTTIYLYIDDTLMLWWIFINCCHITVAMYLIFTNTVGKWLNAAHCFIINSCQLRFITYKDLKSATQSNHIYLSKFSQSPLCTSTQYIYVIGGATYR